MRLKYFCLILSFLTFLLSGQDIGTKKGNIDNIAPNIINNSYTVPESLSVKLTDKRDTSKYKIDIRNNINGNLTLDDPGSLVEKNAPWLVAALISIASLIIAWRVGKHQIIFAKKQIDANLKIAEKQIKSDIDISTKNIKSSIINANRQEWINTLREISATYISAVLMYNNEYENQAESGMYKEDKITSLLDKIISNSFQIELLLNPLEEKSMKINACMTNVNKIALEINNFIFIHDKVYKNHTEDIVSLLSNFKEIIKKILKEEWEKVKKID